jgi:cytidylate kinase
LFEIAIHQAPQPKLAPALKFSIAISREMGAGGKQLASSVGARLGWPVYDHELLEEIAADLHVRVGLLESVDERHVSWLQERMEAFAAVPFVSESTYVRQLIETLLSLSLRGHAVIVGRGAPHILSHGSTLTVRVVAKLEDRVENIVRAKNLSHDAAARLVRATDAQRVRFVRDHFQSDPTNPVLYDLVLNTSRFDIEECSDLVVDALAKRQRKSAAASAAARD